MSWRPILSGSLAAVAQQAIDDVAAALSEYTPEHPNLAHGSAGVSLFYGYHGLVADCEASDATSVSIAESMVANLAMAGPATLFGGYPGCGWLVEHLFGSDEEDENDVGAPFDARLATHLESEWEGDYDLIIGMGGLAIYCLERDGKGRSSANLEAIISQIGSRAERRGREITWFTPPELLIESQQRSAPSGYYNLGTAHGVPGLLRVLAKVGASGSALARELAVGAGEWILSNQLGDGYQSAFPTIVGDEIEPSDSRLGWCYGDVGVAACVIAAAIDLGKGDWLDRAVSIAIQAGKRDPDKASVRDVGLCHGTVGIAHLYNRMFQATGSTELGEIALHYYQRALEMRLTGSAGSTGIAGFTELHFEGDSKEGIVRGNPGLLTGAAGVGLALLAAVSDVEPEWDRLFLCDMAARDG